MLQKYMHAHYYNVNMVLRTGLFLIFSMLIEWFYNVASPACDIIVIIYFHAIVVEVGTTKDGEPSAKIGIRSDVSLYPKRSHTTLCIMHDMSILELSKTHSYSCLHV